MVDICKCRMCGTIMPHPMIFSVAEQSLFNFIFANPGCSREDIELGLYGRELSPTAQLVSTRIAHIRQKLLGTNWRLASYRTGKRHQSRYEVLQSTKVPADVPTNRPDCLS